MTVNMSTLFTSDLHRRTPGNQREPNRSAIDARGENQNVSVSISDASRTMLKRLQLEQAERFSEDASDSSPFGGRNMFRIPRSLHRDANQVPGEFFSSNGSRLAGALLRLSPVDNDFYKWSISFTRLDAMYHEIRNELHEQHSGAALEEQLALLSVTREEEIARVAQGVASTAVIAAHRGYDRGTINYFLREMLGPYVEDGLIEGLSFSRLNELFETLQQAVVDMYDNFMAGINLPPVQTESDIVSQLLTSDES